MPMPVTPPSGKKGSSTENGKKGGDGDSGKKGSSSGNGTKGGDGDSGTSGINAADSEPPEPGTIGKSKGIGRGSAAEATAAMAKGGKGPNQN